MKHLTKFGAAMLRDRYMVEQDRTPQDVFVRAVTAYTAHDPQLQARMLRYVDAGWFIPSTPVLANAGTGRGNPIACFLQSLNDTRVGNGGLLETMTNLCLMSSEGGGVGTDWSNIRTAGESTSKGSQSNGAIPFMGISDRIVLAYAQGGTRRASSAEMLDMSHPEIREFIDMRKPSGGDINRKNLNLHHGVKCSDKFMQAVVADAMWDLIDPHSGKVHDTVSARDLFQQVMEARAFQGEPYLIFPDTMNAKRPLTLQLLGVKSVDTNLCTEVTSATNLPNGDKAAGVCCLGSINLNLWDMYYGRSDVDFELFVRDCLHYLWLTLDAFVTNTTFPVESARRNAGYYRDVGLGMLGWHSYLQSRGVAFDSIAARGLNHKVFSALHNAITKANRQLADIVGCCEAAKDAGLHLAFTHTTAIAPNASTSILTNTSAGIEPLVGNAFTRETASGTELWRNPHLEALLIDLGHNTEEVWTSIAVNHGSVQHLDFLDELSKEVYKTAFELNQLYIIEQAADRQQYIDQAQSVNLFFPPNTERSYALAVHIAAWRKGLKTLYYYRGLPQHKASTGMKSNDVVQDTRVDDCIYCAN